MDKIHYLTQQNTQLREQNLQLQQILKMNKTEIDILSSQLSSQEPTKKLMQVILSYREREQKLQVTLNQIKKQQAQLSTDNLVLRQMNEQQSLEIKNMENLNNGAREALNARMKELEDKIAFYEKSHKEYDKVSGFVVKNRDIVAPSELAMQLKNREYEWEDQIGEMRAEVENARKNQENLMVVNTVLRNKIVSLQAQLAMPNRNLGEVLDKSLKKLMLYFIQVQKKIITGEDDSQSDQENDIQLIAPQLSGVFPQKKLRIQRDYGVPHLDLLKIRQQMNHCSNKIKQALIARNHLSDKQKIQRLEIQLEYTRRQLSKNIIDLRQQKDKRKKAEHFIMNLQATNQLLVNSNQQLEAKVRKYWQKLKSQREKAYGMNQNLDTGKGLIDDQFNDNLDQTLKLKSPTKPAYKPASKPAIASQIPAIDYKIHLQIMSNQLSKNKKLLHPQKLKPIPPPVPIQPSSPSAQPQPQPRRLRRSTSNPLLYFNERRGQIMQVKNQDNNERYRLEQTCYNPGEIIGFQDVLDQYQEENL